MTLLIARKIEDEYDSLVSWIKKIDPIEFVFQATRSGGPGGQKVNKTSSAILLKWSPNRTHSFEEAQKKNLIDKLSSKLNSEDEIVIRSEEYRSQDQNKKRALEKLNELIEIALFVPKKRKPGKPTLSSKIKKRKSKEKRSEVKKTRKKIDW